MPKDEDFSKVIAEEVQASDQYFQSWRTRFICERLAEYYEGFQWEGASENLDDHYVLNMIFSTMNIKRPTLLFKTPQFYASPKPIRQDFDAGRASETAALAADVLNTFVDTDSMNFAEEAESSILDAGSHFGIMEVGFDATWMKNPKAGLPILKSDVEPTDGLDDDIIEEPEEIPQEEWIYVKRIDPNRFRVSLPDFKKLSQHKWVGYYDFIRTADFEDSRLKFKNIDQLDKTTYQVPRATNASLNNLSENEMYEGYTKVWKLWFNHEKVFRIIDDGSGYPLYEEPFKRLPLFDLRFHKRRNGFYPIPFFFNWKSPQDEINETRDQLRYIRRRAKRAWLQRKNALDENEREKFLTGPSEMVVECEGNPAEALFPIQSPPIDGAIMNAFVSSKDDFNIASGTGAEARGQADRVTATQANIMDSRSSTREADEREIVAKWYCAIGREILETAVERMTLPQWVKINQDIGSWGEDVTDVQEMWRKVEIGELADNQYKLHFKVESLSPIVQEQEETSFLNFMAVISQYPIISLNPDLILETAYRLGYHNKKVIRAMQQAAQLHIMGQMAGMQQPGAGETNMSQRTTEQMQPPNQAEIENQIANQGVPSA